MTGSATLCRQAVSKEAADLDKSSATSLGATSLAESVEVSKSTKRGEEAVTQGTISRQKELEFSAQNGTTAPDIPRNALELPKWCLFCIAEARQRAPRRLTVVLVAEDQCECPIHDQVVSTNLVEGNFGAYGIKAARRTCPRRKPTPTRADNGRFIKKATGE